jgi:hypothetical protein
VKKIFKSNLPSATKQVPPNTIAASHQPRLMRRVGNGDAAALEMLAVWCFAALRIRA